MSKIKMIPFHKGQQEIVRDFVLDDTKKFGVVCVGRQWGKSVMSMNVMIGWMLENPGSTGGWVTPIAKMWMKAFREITQYAHPYIQSSNKMEGLIYFKNGSILQFLSTENEDSTRGFTFNYLVVDEAGFVKSSAFDILAPTFLAEGRKVMFISTPGIKNWFYDWFMKGFDENSKNTISFKATSYDSPVHTKENLDMLRATTHPDKFKQEYLAEFADASGGVFVDYDKACVLDDYYEESNDAVYFGLDIARGGEDFTSLTIMNEDCEIINREYWQEWDTETQIQRLIQILDKYPAMKRGCIEENQEVAIYQRLKRHYSGKFPILGFYTSKGNKPSLIQNLATDIATGKMKLPGKLIDPILYEEFGNYSFVKKEDGYIKYSAPDGKHDDSVMSTALANHARLPNRHTKRDWEADFKRWNP